MSNLKKQTKKEIELESISYVHDPEAAKKWFELYIDLIKQEIIKQKQQKSD